MIASLRAMGVLLGLLLPVPACGCDPAGGGPDAGGEASDGGPFLDTTLRDAALTCGDDVRLTIIDGDTWPNLVDGIRAGDGALLKWNEVGGAVDWRLLWIGRSDPPRITNLEPPSAFIGTSHAIEIDRRPAVATFGEGSASVTWSVLGPDFRTWDSPRESDLPLPDGAHAGTIRTCAGEEGLAVMLVWFDASSVGLMRLNWIDAETLVGNRPTPLPELGGRTAGSPGDDRPDPELLGCASVSGDTFALARPGGTATGPLRVSRWPGGAGSGEAPVPLGSIESRGGAVAVDFHGSLFLAFDTSADPTLRAYRVTAGRVTEIGARTLGGFDRAVDAEDVLGSVPMDGSTLLLYSAWSFLQAVEVAPDGSMGRSKIVTDVSCRSRSAPVEWGRGFVLPAGCGLRGLGLIGVCTN